MANINIDITNGTGYKNIANANYNVTANVIGYDSTSITPSTLNVVSDINEYNFTIEASGTLTIHVSDNGTSTGNPIVGATLIRTDASGQEYGEQITTNNEGNAVFNYVPYADTNAPTIYFKQTSSDGSHDFTSTILSTNLTTQTFTYELENTPSALRTIKLTDTNYTNLPIDTATITLE